MKVFSQRMDPVKLFWRRVAIAILLILVGFMSSALWRIYTRERESAVLNAESAGHVADLTRREAQLRADIAALNTDRGKEAALRQQYQMGRPGEKMITIVDPTPPPTNEATSSGLKGLLKSWFSWW